MKFSRSVAALLLLSALVQPALAQSYTYQLFDYPGATDTAPQAIDGTTVAGW